MAQVSVDQNRLQTDQAYRAALRQQGYFVGSENGRVYAEYQGGSSTPAPAASKPATSAPAPAAAGGSTPATGGASNDAMAQMEQRIAQLQQQLANALSAATQAQQQEAIREYNANHDLAVQQFQASQSNADRQFAENQRQYNLNTQQDLLKTASTLTGPKDYFQFLNYAHGGQNIVNALQGNRPVQAFGAPQGQNSALGLGDLMQSLGIAGLTGQPQAQGTPGMMLRSDAPAGASDVVAPSTQPRGAFGAQAPIGTDWAQTGLAQQASGQAGNGLTVQGVTIPYAHQINPAVWDSLGASGQQFILGAAAAAGYDPTEYQRQIDAARPVGTAARTTTTSYASPQSGYGQAAGASAF